jgi:hypothetical protein
MSTLHPYFKKGVSQKRVTLLRLNKFNFSNTEQAFPGLLTM